MGCQTAKAVAVLKHDEEIKRYYIAFICYAEMRESIEYTWLLTADSRLANASQVASRK
jgi:hypothetical protein